MRGWRWIGSLRRALGIRWEDQGLVTDGGWERVRVWRWAPMGIGGWEVLKVRRIEEPIRSLSYAGIDGRGRVIDSLAFFILLALVVPVIASWGVAVGVEWMLKRDGGVKWPQEQVEGRWKGRKG